MKKLLVLVAFGFLALTSCGNKEDLCIVGSGNGDCICIEIYDPVCGCDGKTYGNSCKADCFNVPSYTPGECP